MSLEAARRYFFERNYERAIAELWRCHADAAAARDRFALEGVITMAREVAQTDASSRSESQRMIKVAERTLSGLATTSGVDHDLVESQLLQSRQDEIERTVRARDQLPAWTFEYEVVALDPDEVHAYLSKAGSLGWELVAVTGGERDGRQRLYLKRVVSAPSAPLMTQARGEWGFAYLETSDIDPGLE